MSHKSTRCLYNVARFCKSTAIWRYNTQGPRNSPGKSTSAIATSSVKRILAELNSIFAPEIRNSTQRSSKMCTSQISVSGSCIIDTEPKNLMYRAQEGWAWISLSLSWTTSQNLKTSKLGSLPTHWTTSYCQILLIRVTSSVLFLLPVASVAVPPLRTYLIHNPWLISYFLSGILL